MSLELLTGRTLRGALALCVAVAVGAWFGCGSDSDALGPGPGPGTGAGTTTAGGQGGAAGGAGGSGGPGGGSEPVGGEGGSGGAGGAVATTDFAQPGPFAVDQTEGQLDRDGCGLSNQLDYTLFEPAGIGSATLVVLGHGFQRSRANMVEMATHFATYGARVVTPEYCHMSITDNDPEQNAADQIALADALRDGGPVIHAGYSAGGLAAILAASTDPVAVALLALDAVDRNELGVGAAPNVTLPAFGIDGDPSSCNDQNNQGTHLATLVPGGTAVHVLGATHCDFEGPSNGVCTLLCGGEGDEGQRELIRWLATAFVVWQADLDPTGADWVTPSGDTYQSLVTDGVIEAL